MVEFTVDWLILGYEQPTLNQNSTKNNGQQPKCNLKTMVEFTVD